MKKCTYCGRENADSASQCCECGAKFGQIELAEGSSSWDSLSLFPRSAAEWTRSLAMPLFIGCVGIWVGGFLAAYSNGPVWRRASPAIFNTFLPLLGAALLLICSFGKGLQRGFRIWAIIIAFLSIIGGVLAPSLAE